MTNKLRIGVSSCLLGNPVRFDGGHKRDRFLTETLNRHVEWRVFCPELSAGLGTPRETFRLEGTASHPRFVGNRTGEDKTRLMEETSRSLVEELKQLDLRGFILKNNSPSCGMERVKVYNHAKIPSKIGQGLFARTLAEQLPNLPTEEEGRLKDPHIRDTFLTRVFAYDRFKALEAAPSLPDLIGFHAKNKFLLLAHSPHEASALGRLVAHGASMPLSDLLQQYEEGMTRALSRVPSPGRHVNVMEHIAGFLKDVLSPEDKKELQKLYREYAWTRTSLTVPLTLINHHLKKISHPWVKEQTYLHPYPEDLAFRGAL